MWNAPIHPFQHHVIARRIVLVYGLLGGVLIAALQLIEYRFLVVDYAVEVYGGLVAAIFAGLGMWFAEPRPSRSRKSKV